MNVFFVSRCPEEAADMLVDAHVVKMILESCQLLASVWHMGPPEELQKMEERFPEAVIPKLTHKNHPCAIWARECPGNYLWLMQHAKALESVWRTIYGHDLATQHKTIQQGAGILFQLPPSKRFWKQNCYEVSPPALAMPDVYMLPHQTGETDIDYAVRCYRAYYVAEKVSMGYGKRPNRQPLWTMCA